jgi:hypothetical protein
VVIVLDAGALIALERNDQDLWDDVERTVRGDGVVLVPAAALAQAWRGGPRQARLVQALRLCQVVSFDQVAEAAGVLCGRAGTTDVVAASVALTSARRGVEVLITSDPDDLRPLLGAAGATHVRLRPC